MHQNISNVLGETTVGVHQSGKVYIAISKQSDVCHSTARKIIRKWKTFKIVANPSRSGCLRTLSPRSVTVRHGGIFAELESN